MAYADSIRAVTATFNDVATLIEGQLVKSATVETDSLLTNSTTADWTQYTGSGITITVASGEKVFLSGSFNYSGTSGQQLRFVIRRGTSTAITDTDRIFTHSVTATDGIRECGSIQCLDNPGAGTYTYYIYWIVQSTSYSKSLQFTGFTLRNS